MLRGSLTIVESTSFFFPQTRNRNATIPTTHRIQTSFGRDQNQIAPQLIKTNKEFSWFVPDDSRKSWKEHEGLPNAEFRPNEGVEKHERRTLSKCFSLSAQPVLREFLF